MHKHLYFTIKRTAFLAVLGLMLIQAAAAQTIWTNNLRSIDISKQEMFKAGQWYFFNDKNDSLNIQKINEKIILLNKFQPLKKNTPNFGFTNNNVWFIVEVKNTSDIAKLGFLKFTNPILNEVDRYVWNKDFHRFVPAGKSGDQIKFNQRAIDARNLLFSLDLEAQSSKIFLFKINGGGEQFYFNLFYQSLEQTIKTEQKDRLFFGGYFGLLLFIAIFSIFMFVVIKDKTSLYYLFYIISLGLLQFSLNGFAKQMLWPSNLYISNHADPIFASLGILFLLLFSHHFLNLNKSLPRIGKIFKWAEIIVFINVILAITPLTFARLISILFINGATLLLSVAIIPIAIIVAQKGRKSARFFLAAFVILVIAVMLFVLRNFGILPPNALTNYGLQFGSAAEVILLSIAIVDQFKDFRDEAMDKLDKVNEILEIKVKERTIEIAHQKGQIEEQNKEIVSSIEYAKRIQDAILPSKDFMRELLPSFGLLYLPKDIVAGDFYWVEALPNSNGSKVCFAVADCTGHGVPGAMVSMVCHNALKNTLNNLNTTDTGKFLDQADSLINNNFSEGSLQINDGMDISFACWDKEKQKIYWSGANNSLWLISNKELKVFKADRQPIGRRIEKTNFTTHEIDVKPKDRLILFSDGYADQFGGKEGKKFKSKHLQDTILSTCNLSVEKQAEELKTIFRDWTKNQQQIDDVTILIVEIMA